MKKEIETLSFILPADTKDYISKKIDGIHNAENLILEILISLKKDNDFRAYAFVDLRWGTSIRVQENDFDLITLIDKLVDKLKVKIITETEKIKGKRWAYRYNICGQDTQ